MFVPPVIKPPIPLPANASLVFAVDNGAGGTDAATGNPIRRVTSETVSAFLQEDTKAKGYEHPGTTNQEMPLEGYLLASQLDFRVQLGSRAQLTLSNLEPAVTGEFTVTSIGHAFVQVHQGSGIPIKGTFKRSAGGLPEGGL